MSDTPETPSAKRRRLRWITLAELIGVLALIISAASYWDAHREAAAANKPATPAALLLAATPNADRAVLALKPAHGDAVVQTQTLILPTDVRGDNIDTTGDARIEAGWLDTAIRRNVPSAHDGHPPRLPVGIVTEFMDNGAPRRDAAIYDVGYTLHTRLLRPRVVELEGISLIRRVPVASLRAAVDARWTAAVKAAKLATAN